MLVVSNKGPFSLHARPFWPNLTDALCRQDLTDSRAPFDRRLLFTRRPTAVSKCVQRRNRVTRACRALRRRRPDWVFLGPSSECPGQLFFPLLLQKSAGQLTACTMDQGLVGTACFGEVDCMDGTEHPTVKIGQGMS